MFSLTNYLLFLPAVLVITLLPGPDFAIVVKTALLSGRRQALACVLGINCGVAVHTIAAILGISAVIAGSAELFAVLKWAGAAYLFYLGLRSLLTVPASLALGDSLALYAVPAAYSEDGLYLAQWDAGELEPMPACSGAMPLLRLRLSSQGNNLGTLLEVFKSEGVSYAQN